MRGFRLTRIVVKAAIRESRRQQQRKKVQTKSKVVLKNAYPAYVPSQASQQYYQPPQPPQYGNQSSFYNQPTEAFQPPQYQQPIQLQPMMSQKPQSTFRQNQKKYDAQIQAWYDAHPRGKTALGCGILIIALLICIGISSAVYGSVTPNQGSVTASATQPATSPTTGSSLVLATQQTQMPTTVQTSKPTSTPNPTPKPTPRPTPKPTSKPQPTHVVSTPTPVHTGVNGNPWGYDFSPGHLIYYPPNGFCNYFKCISSFKGSDDPGDGYIIECRDQTYSQSGGERGACSYHGGESRPLYSH